jgi:lipopolysaccharide export system permease protein
MSVCEMQHEVDKQRADFIASRREFVAAMKFARDSGIKLDPALSKIDTRIPSSFTLGGLYCRFVRTIGVPELQAQQSGPPPGGAPQTRAPKPPPPQPKPVTPVPAKITAGAPAPGAAGARPPAQHPAPAQTPPAAPHVAPSSGTLVAPTPSTIAMAQVRMTDARTSIASYEIEIHKKFALAVACFVFVLLGAPIALRFPRGGVGLTIGVSLFVFALYYIGLTAGAAAASNGLLPPVVAMWAANVIFTLVALVLLAKMGNEGSTARGGEMQEVLGNAKRWIIARLHAVKLLPDRRAEA